MEFDLESFMSEVTVALQPLDAPLGTKRSSNWERNESRNLRQERLDTALYHESSECRSKRRRLSPPQGDKELEGANSQSRVWDEFISSDTVDEIGHSIPANFYPGMILFTS